MSAQLYDRGMQGTLSATEGPRPRFNVHRSHSDPAQRMIYLQRKGGHLPPHANRRELTKIIIAGHSVLVIYDDAGNETARHDIKPDGNFAYTLAPGTWHSNFNESDEVVFFEVLAGPYDGHDVMFLKV